MQSKEELVRLILAGRSDVTKETAELWARYLVQLNGCHLFSVDSPEKDEKKWLLSRKSGIGGSEIAAIMGENSWSSPRQVWMSKMGMFDDDPPPQSEPARWGNLLETTVATEYGIRNDLKWVHIPVILQDDEKPWLLANIDGFTLTNDTLFITGIYEVKTTSAYNEDIWKEGPLPFYYMCQTNWYCGITRLGQYTIVCLCGGQHLYGYTLPADPVLFKREVDASDTFWNVNVLQGIEPEATDVDKEFLMNKLNAALPEPTPIEEALIFDDDETNRMLDAFCVLREKEGALKKIRDALYAQILIKMGAKTQAVGREHTVVLSTTSKRSCDLATLQRDFPEAYDACVGTNTSCKLTIK